MFTPAYTKQFEKDLRKIKRRNKDIAKLKGVIIQLLSGGPLDSKFKNHKLVRSFVGRWECHIESDWLLIYKIDKEVIIFERTGSHSDIFK